MIAAMPPVHQHADGVGADRVPRGGGADRAQRVPAELGAAE